MCWGKTEPEVVGMYSIANAIALEYKKIREKRGTCENDKHILGMHIQSFAKTKTKCSLAGVIMNKLISLF